MKALLLGAAIMACTIFTASAQKGVAVALPLAAGDTAVNTTPITRSMPTFSGGYSALQIQVTFASNSGTLAGTLKLMGSLDGVNYTQVDSSRTVNTTLVAPIFNEPGAPLNYYKVTFTGTGTQSSTWTIRYRDPVYQTM